MELPSSVVWIARANLIAVALLGVASLFGGLAMNAELWSPGALWSHHFYGSMLKLHGLSQVALAAAAFAGCFGYVLVARLVEVRRIPAPAIGWVAFAVWLIGVGATVVVLARDEWTLYVPESVAERRSKLPEIIAPLAFAGAAVLYACHLGAIVIGSLRAPVSPKVATAALFVLAIAVAGVAHLIDAVLVAKIALDDVAILGLPTPHSAAMEVAMAATRAAVVVLATAAIVGQRAWPLALTAMGIGVLWAVVPMTVLVLGLVGLWIGIAIVNGFSRPSVVFVVVGCAPALVMLAVSGRFARPDFDPHDTYFVVGAQHLVGMTAVCAAMAALHAWGDAIGRVPHAMLVWIGGSLASAGMLFSVWEQMRVGADGMPRRYWDYDPMFVDRHQLAGIGAGVAVLGVAVLASAWVLGSRPRQHPKR